MANNIVVAVEIMDATETYWTITGEYFESSVWMWQYIIDIIIIIHCGQTFCRVK